MAVDRSPVGENLKFVFVLLGRIVAQTYGRLQAVPLAFEVICSASFAEVHVEYDAVKIALPIYLSISGIDSSIVRDGGEISQELSTGRGP